jgi:hypothetical protein
MSDETKDPLDTAVPAFTPGPWFPVELIDTDERDVNVIDKRAFEIAAGKREGPFQNKGRFHPSQAEYYTHEMRVVEAGMDHDYSTIDGGIANEADARLIAAAPDLYHALEMLRSEMADYIQLNHLGDVYHNRSMQMARDALKKALGIA